MKDLKFLEKNIIAHRGCHNKYPENTINAFKEAIKRNYTIELDIHLLKDGTIVVFHDDNLFRMTNKNLIIKDCYYEEIKNIKILNTNNYIPRLIDVLDLVAGKVPIIIELKYDQKVGLLERELVKILDYYQGIFCVKSFNPLIVNWFKKNRPNYIRGLLLSNQRKTIKEKFCHTKLAYLLAKPDFISCNYLLYNEIKKYKIPIIAWTIKNEKQYLKYRRKFTNLIVDFDIKDLK